MFKIKRYNEIDKRLSKNIYLIEKETHKNLNETKLNKQIQNKINREASLLGKEKLICSQIVFLYRKSASIKDKGLTDKIRQQLIYLYIELFKLNHTLHKVLLKELRADAVLLRKWITIKLENKQTYKDFINKTKKLANGILIKCKYHMKMYYDSPLNKKAHLSLAVQAVSDLETLKEMLKRDNHLVFFRKLILTKATKMFKKLLILSDENSRLIAKYVRSLKRESQAINEIEWNRVILIIDHQINALHHFAQNYNNYIIHSEPFYIGKKKHIIITHDVKPVF